MLCIPLGRIRIDHPRAFPTCQDCIALNLIKIDHAEISQFSLETNIMLILPLRGGASSSEGELAHTVLDSKSKLELEVDLVFGGRD